MSFRFVHAADLHLDTPFQGIGQISLVLQTALRDASLNAFDALVDLCIDEDAAFLLLAGDIYDGVNRGLRAQLRFVRGLEKLADHEINVFVIHGNHDPVGGAWSAIRSWPPNVTVFGSDDVEAHQFLIDDEPVATIYGMSYPTQAVTENLSARYRRHPVGGVHIGLLHATVGTSTEHDSYSPCALADLTDGRMDYWALGHIHKRELLTRSSPWVVYPGNLQGRSPKPSEMGIKGAYVVEVVDDAIQEPVFVALDQMRFVAIEVDIGSITDLQMLQQRLGGEGDRLRATHDRRGLIVRVRLHGRGALHAELQRPDAKGELLQDLRDLAEGSEPILWWSAIRDDTRSDLDREKIKGNESISAGLIAVVDEQLAGDELSERFQAALKTPSFVRSAGFDEDLDAATWQTLIGEAEELALDLLEMGGAS